MPIAMPEKPDSSEKSTMDFAAADTVGQPAQKNCRHAPGDAQDRHQIVDVLGRQMQIPDHGRRQGRDDPTVQADQAETQGQERDGLPFIIGVPALLCGHLAPPLFTLFGPSFQRL
jgi:hypothetical protein